jgi:hypothetical protein
VLKPTPSCPSFGFLLLPAFFPAAAAAAAAALSAPVLLPAASLLRVMRL